MSFSSLKAMADAMHVAKEATLQSNVEPVTIKYAQEVPSCQL